MKVIQYLGMCVMCILVGAYNIVAQTDTISIGFGSYNDMAISSSPSENNPNVTLASSGFMPNENAASRFLSMATLGHSISDIEYVVNNGYEGWIDYQLSLDIPETFLQQIRDKHQEVKIATGDPTRNSTGFMFRSAWWNYHMKHNDLLRQRVAFALSEILVISEYSAFGEQGYAMGVYYDMLLEHAFGNYRNLLEAMTYNAAMGVYLTYMNNPKTDTDNGIFADENYAREIMQLFTIGLYELEMDGTRKLDSSGNPIPTYDNEDIAEFSKVFTGLSWFDRFLFGGSARKDTSYIHPMKMHNGQHEKGRKYLLNGFIVPDRFPADGVADITDALNNLFEHPNTAPFISHALIQRLVTSNPSPEYIARVAQVFADNGAGVRGDMAAVVRAILLDEEAKLCSSMYSTSFGKLKEPFVRYVQISNALNAYSTSGTYRNNMHEIFQRTGQRPMGSPSVFNFFQPDHQPIGAIENANLVAPEFQLMDAQKIKEWVNGLYKFVVQKNPADENKFYPTEDLTDIQTEHTLLDIEQYKMYSADDDLPILLDKLNMLFSYGRLSDLTTQKIINTIKSFPNDSDAQKERRVTLAIYLVLSSPEYLIFK